LDSLRLRFVFLLEFLTGSLLIDAIENLLRTLIGRRRLYSRDDVVVVEIVWTEQIDVRTALVALAGAVAAIVAVASVLTLCLEFLLGGDACGLLLGVQPLTVL
jgi:hypothetical protein